MRFCRRGTDACKVANVLSREKWISNYYKILGLIDTTKVFYRILTTPNSLLTSSILLPNSPTRTSHRVQK